VSILRFTFSEGLDTGAVEGDMALAIFAAECVYGRPRVRMETAYLVDEGRRACVVDVRGEAGEAAVRVFTGLTAARLGDTAFVVRRMRSSIPQQSEVATA